MTQDPKPQHPHNRKKRHPNWGGRRLGAGAPRGNMNALKPCPERAHRRCRRDGRRSEGMAKVGMVFAANPVVRRACPERARRPSRRALLAIADRWERKQVKADEVAGYILAQVLERGLRRGDARLEEYLEETLGRRIDAKSREGNLE